MDNKQIELRAAAGEDLARQASVDAQLLLTTPLAIVVRARLECEDGIDDQDIGLVISRQRCRGDRPSGAALLRAARLWMRRLARAERVAAGQSCRVSAWIEDRWQPLVELRRTAAVALPNTRRRLR